MNASHLTIRNVPGPLAEALDAERRRRGVSLNQAVLELLSQALGVSGKRRNGLVRLSGTWSDRDAKEFFERTSRLNEPDPELWT